MPMNNNIPIFETTHWEIALMNKQRYLGRCVVVLKRNCGDLSELTNEEMLDFLAVVRELEDLLRKTFNATMFNWSCLMNAAYRESPPNPQVHWHFRPRYNHPVEFANELFEDPNFGEHYLSHSLDNAGRIVAPELQAQIVSELRKNL